MCRGTRWDRDHNRSQTQASSENSANARSMLLSFNPFMSVSATFSLSSP
jgi:hypothetical protein